MTQAVVLAIEGAHYRCYCLSNDLKRLDSNDS
jgi:hypothetical protein